MSHPRFCRLVVNDLPSTNINQNRVKETHTVSRSLSLSLAPPRSLPRSLSLSFIVSLSLSLTYILENRLPRHLFHVTSSLGVGQVGGVLLEHGLHVVVEELCNKAGKLVYVGWPLYDTHVARRWLLQRQKKQHGWKGRDELTLLERVGLFVLQRVDGKKPSTDLGPEHVEERPGVAKGCAFV